MADHLYEKKDFLDTEDTFSITLPASTLPSEGQSVMSVPASCAETVVVSVSSSHQGAYRVSKRITDFFYTVRAEFRRTVRGLRSSFRSFIRREQYLIPAVCCGYSRTILGWRL